MMRRRQTKRAIWNLWAAKHGNAGVEFALVMPLLVIMLFGGIEMGRALHDFHVVNETVRDAARYLSRVPATCASAGVGVGVLGDPNDETVAKALAMTGHADTLPPAPDLLGYWDYPADAGTVTVRIDCIDNSGGELQGLYAAVTFVPHIVLIANVPFTFLFGGLIAPDGTIDITLSHNVISIGL